MRRPIASVLGAVILCVVLGKAASAHESTRTQIGPLTVTTSADTGVGSLRWAITRANAVIGPDSIQFAIGPDDPGHNVSGGTWMISPLEALPRITDGGLTIDGLSQARAVGGDPNPFGPEIEINGKNLSGEDALTVQADGVQIRGVTINRCGRTGICFVSAKGGQVFGCYLGTTTTGEEAAGNAYGIQIIGGSRDIVIGELIDPTYGNLISGNATGVFVQEWSVNISIIGNRIGTNRTGTDTLGNTIHGICIQDACDNTKILHNLVGGNRYGIYMSGPTHSHVASNVVGTNDSWSVNLANSYCGIYLTGGTHDNLFLANTVGNSSHAGIMNFGANCIRNRLSQNLVSRNLQKGIENSWGGNGELPAPVIFSVAATAISGRAGPGNIVEVFADDSLQGMFFLGSVPADSTGAFTFPLGDAITRRYVTATATDTAGNTSEFSLAYLVTSVWEKTGEVVPTAYSLSQNYPNPFNPSTTIKYELPKSSHVSLTVFDILGREVSVLVNERRDAGVHEVRFEAAGLASGVYFYRLQAGPFVDTKKLLLVR